MNTIKFDVEDSKVSEILQALLNSGVAVKNVEVSGTQHSKTAMVSELCSVEDSGSSFTLYRHGYCSTEIISDVKLVGGTIFCIDDTADGEYQFFDTWGNLVENVRVGDRPYYYKVIEKGYKDKYYIYHDEVYNNLAWTYCKEGDYVYKSLSTSKNIRFGRINTEIVMSKDDGAYVTINSNGCPTIWYQLQQVRNTKVGGCDDWFVPSLYEIELLRNAITYKGVSGGIIAGSSYDKSVFSNRCILSSSEYSDKYSWCWYYRDQIWTIYSKNDSYSAFFIRAF